MNIQSTGVRKQTLLKAQQQQQQAQPAPPQGQEGDKGPQDSFHVNFSKALETTVPMYSSTLFLGIGAFAGALAGGAIGGAIGGSAGAVLGLVGGATGGVIGGIKVGRGLGNFVMDKAGAFGEAHNSENPAKGRATAQAVAGGALTFFTGSPLMTGLVVGGSAAWAAHKSAAE